MARISAEDIERIAAFVRERPDGQVSLEEVMGLAGLLVRSFEGFFLSLDAAVYRELRDIAAYITAMKDEIGRLQPHELKARRIPEAGEELGAIVEATEAATHAIMEAAEAVMAADPSDSQAYRALVQDKMLQIFEACSFQDITGQRISKVVTTLQQIEARLARFSETVRIRESEGAVDDGEAAYEARRKALLLHGPQRKGEAIAQSEIDALFG